MKLNSAVVVLTTLALAVALPLGAQMGFGMGSQIPTLSGVWHPVVGVGSSYEITDEGKKTNWDFLVVGKEDLDGKTAYWVESSMMAPEAGGEVIAKILETVDGDRVSTGKLIFQMPGQAPMEMDPTMMNMRRRGPSKEEQAADADFRKKAEYVGMESITVPAGTFTCQHYRMKDGSGEGWISDKVSPWSLVKMQDKQRTIVLAKIITDAKDRITGTPRKFDPMEMMRNRMGQQGQ
jgi:hypothetical protein